MKLDQAHRDALTDVLRWRRDVRHFKTDPIAPDVMDRLRGTLDFAPSVGNARPWRIIQVESALLRAQVIEDFEAANADAAGRYSGQQKSNYMSLKLAGLHDAPVHLAVFTETDPDEGHGLGRQTMPEMLRYSTVAAIHTLWLAARAENIGLGWVSILDPDNIAAILDAPETWTLTGYLCLGHADFSDDTPLLHRSDWQENTQTWWQKR